MANKKSSTEDETENVRVYIRVRPLNKKEQAQKFRNIVLVDKDQSLISLTKPDIKTEKPKVFKFDYIFPDDSSQVNIMANLFQLQIVTYTSVDGFI